MPSHPDSETAVFPEDRYALAQPRGRVTGDVVVDYGSAMAFHPDWQPGFTEVWDMRFTSSIDITPTYLPRLMELERATKEALTGSRTIIVTDRPMILYSAQFYARFVKPLGRVVVAVGTGDEAAELLGIEALPDLAQR